MSQFLHAVKIVMAESRPAITQLEASERCGIPRTTLRRFLEAKEVASVELAAALCKRLSRAAEVHHRLVMAYVDDVLALIAHERASITVATAGDAMPNGVVVPFELTEVFRVLSNAVREDPDMEDILTGLANLRLRAQAQAVDAERLNQLLRVYRPSDDTPTLRIAEDPR